MAYLCPEADTVHSTDLIAVYVADHVAVQFAAHGMPGVKSQIMAPFLFGATKRLLRESFGDPSSELPRRIAAKPQLYGLVRAATAAALDAQEGRRGAVQLRSLSCVSAASVDSSHPG